MAGLTSAGFTRKTYQEVKTDLEADVRASSQFGTSAQLHSTTVLGQLLAVFALALSAVWEALLALYQAWDPASATGTALDNLLVLAGTIRLSAAASTAPVTVTGTAGATVFAGTLFRIPDTDFQFAVDEDFVLTAGTGTGTVTCTITGPVAVLAATITEQVTVSAAIATVTNGTGTAGRDIETDSAARTRLYDLLAEPEGAGVDSIYRQVQELTGITEVRVYENDTGSTDGDGRPSKSLEVVIVGSGYVAADLGAIIWTYKPAGIETYGTSSVAVEDSQGGSQTVEYTVATTVNIYISAALTVDAEYPDDGDDQVQEAIYDAMVADAGLGRDVIYGRIVAAAYSIPGVIGGTIATDTIPGPTGTANLTIGVRQIASHDLVRIIVAS